MTRAALVLAGLAAALALAVATPPAGAGERGEITIRKGEQRRVVLLGLRRDGKGLARFANMAADPSSEGYRRFIALGKLREQFGAAPKALRRARRFLNRAGGVRSVELSSTGAVLMAVVGAGAGERLFCASGMRPPQKGLCVPRKLDNAVRQVTAGELYKPGPPSRSARVASGTPQGCDEGVGTGAFTPNQLSAAYGTGELNARGLRGEGESAVVLSGAFVDESAFATWAGCFGQPTPGFRQVAMPSATLETSTEPDETYLDVEALAVAAPNLAHTTAVFVPLDLSFPFSFDLFMFGALDPARQGGELPSVLSISDSECEPEFNAHQRRIAQHFLAAAAALGVTSVAASGDLGFLGCQEGTQAAGYPASSRWVTGVGGTDVTLDAQNRIADQRVWSTFGDGSGDTTGSGGGPSVEFGRPPWQTGPGIDAAIQPNGSNRLTPDVASMASFTPGVAVYGGAGGWDGGGGTSAATPLVAGMLALITQQERAAGRPPLGSANPTLYALARGPAYSAIFADIVSGTSSPRPDTPLGRSPAGGAAQPGYDLATGLGQPLVPALADAIAARAP